MGICGSNAKEAKRRTPSLHNTVDLNFVARGNDVEQFVEDLLESLVKIKYFEHKMLQHKITVIGPKKAKVQLIMYVEKDPLRDPDLTAARELLKSYERIREVALDSIAHFFEQ